MTHRRFVIEPLSVHNFERFSALHEGAGCAGCYCMYWQYPGDNRAWQMEQPERNRAAKRALLAEGRTHGLLALDADEGRAGQPVGALQLEPRATLVKLTSRMPYKQLGADDGVWSIACLLVRESHRRQGVARALVEGAISHLRGDRLASSLEAYPRLGEELRDEELWTGPAPLFEQLGFTLAREHAQYPVYRLSLRDEA